MTLDARVAAAFARLVAPGERCLVAVSGGPDSLALLHLLVASRAMHQHELVVGHVDHGIDPSSAVATSLVRDASTRFGLRCVVESLGLGPATGETRARAARRAALVRMADAHACPAIVLGHHADDQAETVLMRVLRGTGVSGLAAMRPRRGRWVRPLLAVRRAELSAWLAQAGVSGWDDPANTDPRHDRSWLRSRVMPLIEARRVDAVAALLRVADHAAATTAALDQLPSLLPDLGLVVTDGTVSVAAPPLRGYRSPVRREVLRALGRQLGARLGDRHLMVLERLLASPMGAGRVRLRVALEAELAFDRLTFHQAASAPFPPADLAVGANVRVGDHRIRAAVARRAGQATRSGWEADLLPGRYRVRPWRAGDRIEPLGGSGSRAVATLLREARIAPSQRVNWPVVTRPDDATIVWVPGICRSGIDIPQPGAEGLHVDCAVA